MMIPEYTIDFGSGVAARGQFSVSSNLAGDSRKFAYSIDDGVLTGLVAGNVSPTLLDLADVFRAISLMDRRARRTWPGDPRPPEQRWPRRLIAPIPVREPDFWRSSQVDTLLKNLLWYLSGDFFDPSFPPIAERTRSFEAQARLPLRLSDDIRAVTLLSGGLDSVFGLINCIQGDQPGRILATSAHTHHRQLSTQAEIVQALRRPVPHGWGQHLAHAPVSIELTRDLTFREKSQKTRVLLFLSIGMLAAVGAGLDRLIVAENGPGALNLPGNETLRGPQLNRAMHPTTLQLVGELISLAAGKPFTLQNVGLGFTKRQMVSMIVDAGFGKLLELTVSCDRFPYLPADKHCGRCSSCLLRALALLDVPVLFDRIGQATSRDGRLAVISNSGSFAHLAMLGWKLDDVLARKDPMQQLWVRDPNVKAVLANIEVSDLLAMLSAFRQDISDLQLLIDGDFEDLSIERLPAISGS